MTDRRQEREPVLRVAPFLKGAATRERVVVRCLDQPRYLSLSLAELEATEELAKTGATVSEFLGRYLAGGQKLDLKAAVALLLKLNQASLLVGATPEAQARLAEFAAAAHSNIGNGARKAVNLTMALLDLRLLSFDRTVVHPSFRALGRILISTPFVALQILLVAALGFILSDELVPSPEALTAAFAAPERIVGLAFVAMSVATSWLAFVQAATLAGAGATFVGGGLRLTGLCVVRFAVDDEDASMLPRGALLRYRLTTLLMPWVSGLLLFSVAGHLSIAFALLGVLAVCPLYRSAIVRTAEGFLATTNLMDRLSAFLAGGLFTQIFKKDSGASQRGRGERHGEHSLELWLTALACGGLVWLYGTGLLFYDALVSAVPDLWIVVTSTKVTIRSVAAGFLLVLMALGALLPFARLLLIPAQNLAAAFGVPLRRARRGLDAFYNRQVSPTEAVMHFLKEIPVLADLSDSELQQLMASMKYRPVAAGQEIIRKGDPGEEFFILASGQAQVVLGGGAEPEQVVDMLSPGDSFGEIALVERVKRTATIRAATGCRLFILERKAFDALFPEGSEGRARLTRLIRQVKLVLESAALSHLAPRQIRELLRSSRSVTVAAGDFLIRENAVGEAAYLIEQGAVEVVREDEGVKIAELGRGELVGAVALIKNVTRTASVRATQDLTCLEIDKPTFLRMCLSNMFVALLVADLSDKQLAAARKAG